jgi:hypothetical protein
VTLRGAILGFGAVLVAGGIVAGLAGAGPPVLGVAVMGLLIVLGTVFEGRYRAQTGAPGPGWERTGERFREQDGAVVDVWFHPASGERRYVRR